MLNKRVHLLFEKDMWNKIVKHSKDQKISAGEYVRRAIDKYLSEKPKEEVVEVAQARTSPFKGLFKSKSQ